MGQLKVPLEDLQTPRHIEADESNGSISHEFGNYHCDSDARQAGLPRKMPEVGL